MMDAFDPARQRPLASVPGAPTEVILTVEDDDIISAEDYDPIPYAVFEVTHETPGLDDDRPPICEAPPALQPGHERRVGDRRRQRRIPYTAVALLGTVLGFAAALALFRFLG